MFVVVLGNLTDGFRFVGPFASFDEADEWANGVRETAWIATLEQGGATNA